MPPKNGKKKQKNSSVGFSGPSQAKSGTAARRRQAQKMGGSSPLSSRPVPVVGTSSGSQLVGAPLKIGFTSGNSAFSMGSNYQRLTDVTGAGASSNLGLRVSGTDICQSLYLVTSDNKNNSYCLGTGGTAAVISSAMAPSKVSTRLSTFESLYQFYAFRRLVIRYVPGVSPDASAIGGSVITGGDSFALGVVQNFDSAVDFSASSGIQLFSCVREYNPSVSTPAWMQAALTYVFSGMRVWESSTNPDNNPEFYDQIVVIGSWDRQCSGSSTLSVVGFFEIDYVIDFYCPSPVIAHPALSLARCLNLDGLNLLLPVVRELLLEYRRKKLKDRLVEEKKNSSMIMVDEPDVQSSLSTSPFLSISSSALPSSSAPSSRSAVTPKK